MKTAPPEIHAADVPILLAAAQDSSQEPEGDVLERARAFSEPLLAGRTLDTGEDAWAHAREVAGILAGLGASPALQAAALLVYAGESLQQPESVRRLETDLPVRWSIARWRRTLWGLALDRCSFWPTCGACGEHR